jgi:hypothetical protein
MTTNNPDASRKEFEDWFFQTHGYSYSAMKGEHLKRANAMLTGWQAARSDKGEAVANKQTPYTNCQFQICDLPGQCRMEGKCHHPAYLAAPQQAISRPYRTYRKR